MKCNKCGAEIPNDSVFCPNCGAKAIETVGDQQNTPATKDIQATVNETFKNIQNNENVQKAQQSIMSGWGAIMTVLKNPTAKVTLGIGEMIVILIIAALCHTLTFLFGINSFINGFMGAILGGWSSFIDVGANFFLCLIAGVIFTITILGVYTLVHAVKEKGFSHFKENLPGDVIGIILPSVCALLAAVLFLMSFELGLIAVIMGAVCILVYIFKTIKDKNQYGIIIIATISLLILAFVTYLMVGMNMNGMF